MNKMMFKKGLISIALLLPSYGNTTLLCPTCSEQVLSEGILANNLLFNDIRNVWLIKNEILAVKGEKFDNPELQQYFEQQEWYQPSPSKIYLTEIEKRNIEQLDRKLEQLIAYRAILIRDLNQLKSTPREKLSSQWNIPFNDSELEIFLALLNKVNLIEIGQSRVYSVIVDNGEFNRHYRLIIDSDKLRLSYHLMASETGPVIEDREEYYQWNFKIENNEMVFQNNEHAG